VDVSFISLEKVLPAVAACLADPAEIVALVKPQFEVGRARVGKGRVVRAWDARRDAVRRVALAAASIGLRVGGVAASVLHGPKGNRRSSSISPATSARARDRGLGPGGEALAAAIEAEGRST
jgi:predicted rRNA methylase YqxC with S4 and FtsJ domains